MQDNIANVILMKNHELANDEDDSDEDKGDEIRIDANKERSDRDKEKYE
jgi:hypothetical protein